MARLTQKQEKAAHKFVTCGNKSEAYRYAYSCKNMKAETINRKACELFKDGKVTARVDELQEASKKRSEITTDLKKEWLKEVIERSLQHEQAKDSEGNPIGEYKFGGGDVIRAVNELNKMDGDHAPVKNSQTNKDGGDTPLSFSFVPVGPEHDS